MFDSVRAYVLAELDLPADWRVVDEQRMPSSIDRETVIVKHSRVEPMPELPIGHLLHELVLGVFVPNKDLALAEDRLDAVVTQLIAKIDGHSIINWQYAQKVITPDGQWPGWEINLTAPTKKPEPKEL